MAYSTKSLGHDGVPRRPCRCIADNSVGAVAEFELAEFSRFVLLTLIIYHFRFLLQTILVKYSFLCCVDLWKTVRWKTCFFRWQLVVCGGIRHM